jgi:hypothetical protein
VDTGSREENASKQESRASVLILSEPKRLQAHPSSAERFRRINQGDFRNFTEQKLTGWWRVPDISRW